MTHKAPHEMGAAGVSPDAYSREYFLTECDGHEEFLAGRVPRRLQTALSLAGDLRGKRVLDVGSGRGEVVRHCGLAGAEAYGVDYSTDALHLAQAASSGQTSLGEAHFLRADAQQLPLKSGRWDCVFMLDIVEHLYPSQLHSALIQVRRILEDDGLLIVHTMPNLWYYRIGYPLYRLVQRVRGRRLPGDPRQRWQFVPEVHVNEQDLFRLRRALRAAGFQARVWLQPTQTYAEEANPWVRSTMRFLSGCYPFRWVFCDDIFAVARKAR